MSGGMTLVTSEMIYEAKATLHNLVMSKYSGSTVKRRFRHMKKF